MKISIVMPAYNRSGVISKTLDSIKMQSFQDWECIVVDDHSTDDTARVINEYCACDSRFVFAVNNRKKGAQGARNTGILLSESEWICIFDSDDIMHSDFLEKLANAIANDVDVVSCWCNKVSQIAHSSKIMKWGGNGNITQDLLTGKTYVGYDSAIIRKKKLVEIGLLDENIKAYQEDDTHIRLSLVSNYKVVEEPLLDYVVGATDTISTQHKTSSAEKQYIIVEKHLQLWRKTAYLNLVNKMLILYSTLGDDYKKKMLKQVPIGAIIHPLYSIYTYVRKKA